MDYIIIMKRYIEIIFCRIISVLKDETSVLVLLSAFLSINVLTLIGFVKIIFLKSSHILIPRVYQLLIYIGIGSVNYYHVIYRKKYQTICEKSPDNNLRVFGNRLVLVYIILTIVFLAGLIFFARIKS